MGIGISLSGLASSVANLGGVGVISTVGIGMVHDRNGTNGRQSNIDALRLEIRKARELSQGVIGVNIMSVITNFSDMVRTSLDEGIDILFSGAGLPLDLPKYLREGVNTKLVPIVSSARAASILCKKWLQNYDYLPDALVVEGPKAGGHLGFNHNELFLESNTLERLVADVLIVTREVRELYGKEIPVIAAGGIYTGSDMFKIMQLGASAVQMGTRFIATRECDASDAFKNAFIEAQDEDIRIIISPVGMPGRAINNKFLEEVSQGKRKPVKCKYQCIKSCQPKTTSYCIAAALLAAYRGDLEDGFAFTGANAGRIKAITSTGEVFAELRYEFLQEKDEQSRILLQQPWLESLPLAQIV